MGSFTFLAQRFFMIRRDKEMFYFNEDFRRISILEYRCPSLYARDRAQKEAHIYQMDWLTKIRG